MRCHRLLVFAAMCLLHTVCWAQNFTVTVRSDRRQPVAYAYILINGRGFAATDSLGVGRVPLSRLAIGDTLSVSYIGTTTAVAVIDEAMLRSRSYVFTLREMYAIEIEPVVVQADIEELFRRFVRFSRVTPERYGSLVVSGDLDYKMGYDHRFDTSGTILVVSANSVSNIAIGMDDQFNMHHTVRGRFTNRNRGNSLGSFSGSSYFNSLAEIETASDSATLSQSLLFLRRDIHYALSRPYMWLEWLNARDSNIRYGYLGTDDGCRIFRLSFISADGYTTMCLVFADVETRGIRRLEMRTLSPPEGVERHTFPFVSVDVVADCEGYGRRGAPTTFVNYVKAKIEAATGDMRFSELELSNIRAVSTADPEPDPPPPIDLFD